MRITKRIERLGKRGIRYILKKFIRSSPVKQEDIDLDQISRILVVRQDSRLGNIVLMTPLISGLKNAFSDVEIDVLISDGFEECCEHNPNINRTIVFEKKKACFIPWWYLQFINKLREKRYDLAVDVSNGYHFSLNNMLLTYLSGAKYRLGYNREDASSFINLLAQSFSPLVIKKKCILFLCFFCDDFLSHF